LVDLALRIVFSGFRADSRYYTWTLATWPGAVHVIHDKYKLS